MSISEHEAKTLADFETYEAEVATLRARVAGLEVELEDALLEIGRKEDVIQHLQTRAETAERDLESARGLIARLGDADALESLNALLAHERARVAELERECADHVARLQAAMTSYDQRLLVIWGKEGHRHEADAARLREALEWALSELDATPFDPDEHSQEAVVARWLDTEKARAALASAPSAEPEGPDYSGLCSAPECGGHCGYVHAVGCEAIREYLAEHGGDAYKAPARTAHLAATPSAPTPRDMRVAEAVYFDALSDFLPEGLRASDREHLAAVVAKALEVGT